MNGLLSLFLVGTTLATAADDQAAKPKINVSAQIYTADGKASGATRRIEFGTEPVVLYVYTGKTLCEARTVSAERPVVAGNGWKLELAPASGTPAAKGAAVVRATWQRLWEGGREVSNSASKTNTVTLTPGNTVPLDTIDGAARRAARDTIARMKKWQFGDTIPTGPSTDGSIVETWVEIDKKTAARERGRTVSHWGDGHPEMLALTKEIAALQSQFTEKIHAWAETHEDTFVATPASADGCAALSMNLTIDTEKPSILAPVTETEVWLIHRDPSGKETEQRQVVRSRESAGEYFFDDVKIQTEKGPVTIEIYGSVHESMTGEGGEPWLLLDVRRRYIATGPRTPKQLVFPAYTWKTKEGNTSYRQTIHQNEVVSFQLLPLPDDEGALSGHRFSVRVRMRVLQ